jgi:predicted secreted protein
MPAWAATGFDLRSVKEAMSAAGIDAPVNDGRLRIEAPEFAENGSSVPVVVDSAVAGTTAIALFIDRNPFPYIAHARFFGEEAAPWLSLRTRLAESSSLRAVAYLGDGSQRLAVRPISTAAGGCGGDEAATPVYSNPPAPARLRAQRLAEGYELRALLSHPNENGLRRASGGALIPARHVASVVIRVSGRSAVELQLGRSIATNPLLVFRLPRALPGDQIEMVWRDTEGAGRSDRLTLS